MAGQEEEPELKDLITQGLESKGILGNIKAQIRSAVFMLLEEDAVQRNKVPSTNPDLVQMSSTPEGALVLGLVLDFLQTHHLEFSKSVFEPECAPVKLEKSREQLAQQLGLSASSRRSLLFDLVQQRLAGGAPSAAAQTSSSSSMGARTSDAKGASSTSAPGASKSKESFVQSSRSVPDSSRSDGADYKDDFEADSRGDDEAEEVPEEEDISVAAPLDSARSGGAPAGSRSARDDSVAEVSLAGHVEDESEDVSIGADYAEPVRPQTRK